MVITNNYTGFRGPLDDIIGLVGHQQYNYRCRELELNLADCMDVFGLKGMSRQCIDEFKDYRECLFAKKQIARFEAMTKERTRQYLAGERTKENFYASPPKADSFRMPFRRSF